MRKNDAKSQMKKAIVELLKEKYYADISVTDIVKKAGVARASFYRSYSAVDEVLDEVINEIKDSIHNNYMSLLIKKDDEHIKEVILKYYTDVKEKNVPFVDIPLDNQQYISSRIFNSETMANLEATDTKLKYIPGVKFTIILVLCKFWMDNNYMESPEELAEIAFNCIKQL